MWVSVAMWQVRLRTAISVYFTLLLRESESICRYSMVAAHTGGSTEHHSGCDTQLPAGGFHQRIPTQQLGVLLQVHCDLNAQIKHAFYLQKASFKPVWHGKHLTSAMCFCAYVRGVCYVFCVWSKKVALSSAYITPDANPLSAQDQWNGGQHGTLASHSLCVRLSALWGTLPFLPLDAMLLRC